MFELRAKFNMACTNNKDKQKIIKKDKAKFMEFNFSDLFNFFM